MAILILRCRSPHSILRWCDESCVLHSDRNYNSRCIYASTIQCPVINTELIVNSTRYYQVTIMLPGSSTTKSASCTKRQVVFMMDGRTKSAAISPPPQNLIQSLTTGRQVRVKLQKPLKNLGFHSKGCGNQLHVRWISPQKISGLGGYVISLVAGLLVWVVVEPGKDFSNMACWSPIDKKGTSYALFWAVRIKHNNL